jgi:hypothetical protein
VEYRRFGGAPPEPAPGESPAALMVPSRDGFADPPGLVVREDALHANAEPPRRRG